MARSRSSRFPRSSLVHRPSWSGGPSTAGDGQPISITSSIAVLGGVGATPTGDGITLIRTRGSFSCHLEAATTQGDGFHGAFAIGKATSAAFVAGVASVPTPITEEGWDGWLYHQYFTINAGGPIAAATAADQQNQVNNVSAALRLEVDSKAMRKITIDETFYFVIEVIEFGTAAMDFSFNCRMLTKDMA